MLEHIFSYKDIFDQILNYLSYDDLINLSFLNRTLSLKYQSLLKISYLLVKIQNKFEERPCKKLCISENEKFLSLEYYLSSDQDIFRLSNFHIRQLYFDEQLKNGDLIFIYTRYYILYKTQIYNCCFGNENVIPKFMQQKFNLNRWTVMKYVRVYVEMKMEDLVFHDINFINDGGIIYAKIWNQKLRIWIHLYVQHETTLFDICKTIDFEKNIQKKINTILNKDFQENNNPFYFCKNDVPIEMYRASFGKEWFLGL